MSTTQVLDDPVAFAHALYSHLAGDADPRVCEFAADEAVFGGALTDLDEAAMAWSGGSHAAGIEFGIAAEQLRRSLLAGGDGPSLPWGPVAGSSHEVSS